MQNENNNTTDSTDDIAALESEIHDAVAHGTNVKEAVRHLTLKAMKADRLDSDSLRRIMTAVMQGAREGADQQLQHAKDQSHTAQTQVTDAIEGLDSALAKFAEASKLAMEEAANRTQKFSDTELVRTRSDLESLETMFMDTLKDTASTAKGLVADTLHDLVHHAQRNGTAVGEQLKETLATLAQQMASVGHTQLEAGVKLTHATAKLIRDVATGIITGIEDRDKTSSNERKHDQ
ncbi:MAG: hypothetical protein Q8K59_02640 [Nitrosomonas sp.]|nr:hypothetical protein [Nitrosomonas sp.]MDP1949988.1 hypothetical protein [Nitrosomonas sp.]